MSPATLNLRDEPVIETGPDSHAIVGDEADGVTLEQLIADRPALLGDWSRLLWGDELYLSPQLTPVTFPPVLYAGFRRTVDRTELLGWLAREQAMLRQLIDSLAVDTRERFDQFASIYSDWATIQAQVAWQGADEAALAARLEPFASPLAGKRERLVEWLGQLRRNRAQLVDALHQIDLRREDGNLIMTGAGALSSRFGQPLTVHPASDGRAALEMSYRRLRRLVASGAHDQQLRAAVRTAGLAPLGRRSQAESGGAWLPLTIEGRLWLLEPGACSDGSNDVADVYRPFAWGPEGLRLRLGHPRYGLASDELSRRLQRLDRVEVSMTQLRRVPVALAADGRANLFRVVDEPERWPFFSAHRLELDGEARAPARWHGDHDEGLYQRIVVVRGEVELTDAAGRVERLAPGRPAFIPATMRGGYHLQATGPATVLLFAVPGPQPSLSSL
jgi:hypothetical protein